MRRPAFVVSLLALTLLAACGAPPEGITEPCESGCNESAIVGAPCSEATDCFTGSACNTTFPNGYCQMDCNSSASNGESCATTGRCVDTGETENPVCLAGCDPNNPDSCGRDDAACYVLGGTDGGICHLRCYADADCGQGLSCDGAGICRVQGASCNPLTDAGCDDPLRCFGSRATGTFCGLPGTAKQGEACAGLASCSEGLVCSAGTCQPRCSTTGLASCPEIGSCQPVLPEHDFGVCG